VSLVSFVSVVSLVSPRALVHKKGGFSGDGSHSRIGLLIMRWEGISSGDTQYWILLVRIDEAIAMCYIYSNETV
jgi:hypothetical protein